VRQLKDCLCITLKDLLLVSLFSFTAAGEMHGCLCPDMSVPASDRSGNVFAGMRHYVSLDARSGSSSGRSGRLSFMPPTPQLHNALGGYLDDDEDYVIIDGPSPYSSAHGSMYALSPCWAVLEVQSLVPQPTVLLYMISALSALDPYVYR
jgi:hypothetical protein